MIASEHTNHERKQWNQRGHEAKVVGVPNTCLIVIRKQKNMVNKNPIKHVFKTYVQNIGKNVGSQPSSNCTAPRTSLKLGTDICVCFFDMF